MHHVNQCAGGPKAFPKCQEHQVHEVMLLWIDVYSIMTTALVPRFVLHLNSLWQCRFEASTRILLTFVLGHSEDAAAEEGVQIESEDHGGFMRLPVQVCDLTQLMQSHLHQFDRGAMMLVALCMLVCQGWACL